jgi:aerobic-type carbon monoxide dehydrogenase small subunit (CoxS/CutS family)
VNDKATGTVTDTNAADGEARRSVRMRLQVNGEEHELLFAPYKTLLEVLREDLALTGTKHGCELGECGACAVLVDGQPLLSCLVLAIECEGRAIETVESLARGTELHPLQSAFADLGGAQCGYCTPGILMTAKALLDGNPDPSRDEIKEAISGNLCRCTGYAQILESIEEGARRLRAEGAGGGCCGGCGGGGDKS